MDLALSTCEMCYYLFQLNYFRAKKLAKSGKNYAPGVISALVLYILITLEWVDITVNHTRTSNLDFGTRHITRITMMATKRSDFTYLSPNIGQNIPVQSLSTGNPYCFGSDVLCSTRPCTAHVNPTVQSCKKRSVGGHAQVAVARSPKPSQLKPHSGPFNLSGNCPNFVKHEKVRSALTDCVGIWERELSTDTDRDYILSGVKHGFDILDGQRPPLRASMSNYKSANVSNFSKVQAQIEKEVLQGNYIFCDKPPLVTSSLGAIPKDNGKIRLIHDLSRPDGGLNQFVTDTSTSFQTVDDATDMMSKNCYVTKIDLQSAYRSVPIHPDNYPFTGLSWDFSDGRGTKHLFDARLPFGSAKACQIFQRISNSFARMLKRRGVACTNYLDDILLICDTKSKAWLALDLAINLLTQLGFQINWDKVAPPCTSIVFLGIQINTIDRSLSLPPKKVVEFQNLIEKWSHKRRCSKKDLLVLLGKMNWACKVIRSGRTFLRRLIDLSMRLKKNHHRTWLSSESRADIAWWLTALKLFNGYCPFSCDIPPPAVECYTDACQTAGGAVFGGDWCFTNFRSDHPNIVDCHINVLELATVLHAAKRWGRFWTGYHILIRSDNSSTVSAVNKGTSRSKEFMSILRQLYWLSVWHGFRLTAQHIRGEHNFLADLISRINDPRYAQKFVNVCSPTTGVVNCVRHMTFNSFLSLPL